MSITAETKLSPGEAITRAVQYFGKGGLGLEIESQCGDCVTFTGGGGSVGVVACPQEKGTSVEIESREWDYQVKSFLDKLRR